MSSNQTPAVGDDGSLPPVDLKPLLAKLWPVPTGEVVSAEEIATAVSYFFTAQVSEAQTAALLICLHFTGLDRRADVIAACAKAMRAAAAKMPDPDALKEVVARRGRKEGAYNGGLVCCPSPHQPTPFPLSLHLPTV